MARRPGRLGLAWRFLVNRLRSRPDSEHEMSLNRLVFGGGVLLAVLASGGSQEALLSMAAFFTLAIGVLVHILVFPGVNAGRRLVAVLLDCGFTSWQLHLGGEPVAAFFPIYLWVVFGNGFRFGLPALRIAMLAALAGFGAVIATTEFWQQTMHLAVGLWIGLLILPLYAGTLIRKLNTARQQAEAANSAKSLFLASVSHELRTPLNAIIGMGGLLRGTRLDAEQQEMARTVDSAARSLLALIDDILNLSRIEAGRMPSETVAFDTAELLVELRALLAAQCRDKGLHFNLHVTPRTPGWLRGDRRHLLEVLLNLAGNAVKFTAEGSVTVALDAVPTGPGRYRLAAEISDTGIGIAEEAQERIFENFTQADSSIINRFGGTGLGLGICRQLVGLMGGSIGVRSALGLGSTFFFDIRVESVADAPVASLDGVTLVLLDGAPIRAAALAERFGALGLVTRPAATAEAALDLLRAQPPGQALLLAHAGALPELSAVLPEDLRQELPYARLLLGGHAAGLPPLTLRRASAVLLPEAAEGAELAGGLRLALGIAPGRGLAAAAPATAAEATLPGLPAAAPPLLAAPPGRRLRVLVADDSRVNQRVFAKILESAGHEVCLAENGDAALDLLEREADGLDLVLMDVNMPEMDGIEATKMFRVMALGQPHLPILALTADATEESAHRCREAGMDGHVTKPVQPEELLRIVAAAARAALPGADRSPLPSAAPPEEEQVSVADIASHPRFRPTQPAIDVETVDNLRQLGGDEFLAGLATDFLADAAGLIEALGSAAVAGEHARFQAEAHALRSSAANIGAIGLTRLCGEWRKLSRDELLREAPDLLVRARAELERTRRALLPEAGSQSHRG
ncbi:response regulator [Roseomonas sp. 18066]|uniref:response regulator n=1 Tax=Roseomonas sp. 18066 TaxID=2681412 RepID=UPI00135C5B3B|nr:response regulator [Roseomonas sp. 18066]